MSGNEAIARGAYEAGVTVATGYPGTPSTEILETLVAYKNDIYCEWSPNEKVAFEAAAGASLAGARAIVTMKHVGLNVAADPLMTLSYIGVEGGFIACVADDPGMHSSQTEQDTRHYARLAKIPVFEPSDSQEAKDFVVYAMDISERYRTPVILRSTTRVGHSRSLVAHGERKLSERAVGFIKDPPRHVPIPVWGRVMRKNVEERLHALSLEASRSSANRIEPGDPSIGIIASGIAYQYVREVWPEASVLKLGFAYPFPDDLFREFASSVSRILIVEELDNIVEEHVRSLGITCDGKNYVPSVGELDPTIMRNVRDAYEGKEPRGPVVPVADDLPPRPPVLCPGCPHRGVFYALKKHDVIVTGDIGCYSLGVFKPLERTDAILCMGGGISMAHGLDKAGEPKKVVGIVGDSTFFHSGITGLLDIAYNKGASTIIVVDNRTTAMTGHQDHPGTGVTLMGEKTREASIAVFGAACGIEHVRVVNPYNLTETIAAVTEELAVDAPSLIVSQAPCPLAKKQLVGKKRVVDADVCRSCRLCLNLGCPALDGGGDKPVINDILCSGCGLCEQVCRFNAITAAEVE